MHEDEVKSRLREIKCHSEDLELNLNRREDRFKWFIASILFAKRISSKIASKTFRKFLEEGLTDPKRILSAGWSRLVEVLDLGGYVRYDFSTAKNIIEAVKMLVERYDGDIDQIHLKAKNQEDLKRRLMEFKGVGPTATNIFLRELRGIWTKAKTKPSSMAMKTGEKLGLKSKDIERFEAKLVKIHLQYCKRRRCEECPMNSLCKKTYENKPKNNPQIKCNG